MDSGKALFDSSTKPWKIAVSFLVLLIVLKVTRAVYNLYFHPLSRFPGPRQAALSDSWIHELSRSGKAEEEIEQLHKTYGTHALRIAPNELHISDVSHYKTIYSQSRPFPKHKEFYDGFGTPHTVFVEPDLALHKERRRLLNPFFARTGIFKIEPVLHLHIRTLQAKLARLADQDIKIVAQNAFRCVTIDIITDFAFAKSRLVVASSNDQFQTPFLEKLEAVTEVLWDSIYSPRMRDFGMMLPKTLVAKFSEPLKQIFALADDASTSLRAYQTSSANNDKPVIFDGLRGLSNDLISAEAVDILVAGSDTTAFTLISGAWHICKNPLIKQRLTAALRDAFPKSAEEYPSLLQLESIPYLVACMKESLRIAMPVPGRLPRTVPQSPPLVVDNKAIPPGTVVGMSAYTMHFSEELWGADAREFNPERWLGEESKRLDAHLVTFSKGARSCIGQNLAQAEVMVVLHMLFRNFEVDLEPESADAFVTRDVFTQAVEAPGVVLRLKTL